MNGWVVFVTTVILIVLSAFFVVVEFSLIGARRHRLEAEAGEKLSARAALRGMNELTLMLAAAQLGITLCTFALGAVTKPALDARLGPVFAGWGLPDWLAGGLAFALSLLFVTFLHLVVGEMAPKSWAIAHPELAAKIIGIPSRAFMRPLRPFLTWMNSVANTLVARTGVEPVERAAVGGRDAATIRHLVEHSTQVGVLEPELTKQISEAIRLEEITAADLVTFGEKPSSVHEDATIAEVQQEARMSGHLRVLLRDDRGNYSGVIHVRDTLTANLSSPTKDFTRPIIHIPAATRVPEVMARMREARVPLALVVSDVHGIDVVTMSDVIERVLPADASA